MPNNLDPLQAFQWSRQPAAENLLRGIVQTFLNRTSTAAALAHRMRDDTGTRFFDWIDSLQLSHSFERDLLASGYQFAHPVHDDAKLLHHPEGIFPRILLSHAPLTRISLKVDSVADFLAANQLELPIQGEPFAPMRRATIAQSPATQLDIVERRGTWSDDLSPDDPLKCLAAAHHFDLFRRRNRAFTSDREGIRHALQLAQAAQRDLGTDQTCALFFAAEREFWQRKNHAAQIQKSRQDRLGLGWGNHDHHTYRSSRAHFAQMIAFFEFLGCSSRERFYAGREAGWGAQVLENHSAGIVVFADVDLAPEELLEDFAHNPLPARDTLGTVGLWCGLHGEAFLQAGMHHLECQFDFDALKTQLESTGINVMKPFTDYPYLRQAFTEGQRWPVAESRLQRLLTDKLITPEQAAQFRQHGAIGSHLENLERNEGYKGFNQKGVSEIIAATDPRLHAASTPH
ncbi:MAG TPA: hypothetical protein VGN88_12475 [Phycisphaerae bacterium]|jgi:hypothetical protein